MMQPEKKHDTGLRMLQILKIMLENDVSKSELIEKLKNVSNEKHVYTPEVILKYFNTFELLGLKLIKGEKCRYSLQNALFQVDFSEKELKILYKFIEDIKKLNNKSDEEIMRKLVLKLDKYTSYDLTDFQKSMLKEEKYLYNENVKENVITSLKNMIYDGQSVDLTYMENNGEESTVTVELKEIVEQRNHTYVVCYNPKVGRNKKISLDAITSIKQSPKKASGISCLNSVVFEIYGRLASVYKLKPSEKVLNFSNNHLTISNSEEDKDVLLRRLLKYGENCKIIRPKTLQKEFLTLTDDILKNLEAC